MHFVTLDWVIITASIAHFSIRQATPEGRGCIEAVQFYGLVPFSLVIKECRHAQPNTQL